MRKHLERCLHDEVGTTAIEYAIIGSGVFLAIVAIVRIIGQDLNALFESVAGNF